MKVAGKARWIRSLCAGWALAGFVPLMAQDLPVTSVSFYGIRQVDRAAVEGAIAVTLGEPLTQDSKAMEAALKKLDGVADAKVAKIIFSQQMGLFVGILEHEVPQPVYRVEPQGEVELPLELVETYDRVMEMQYQAMVGGKGGVEDRSQGHSLSTYEPVREEQMRFLDYSEEYFLELVEVLRESGNAHHRSVAAHTLAYVQDKAEVVPELMHAVLDPDSGVRNNAVRALGVMVDFANDGGDLELDIDPTPFLDMIESVVWTDRNKGMAILEGLTESRDPELFEQLKERSLPAIGEMARWDSLGHAMFSMRALGRLAGLDEKAIVEAVGRVSGNLDARNEWIASLENTIREGQAAR